MIKHSLYGVIGNPIEHSLSPQLHAQFAHQFNRQSSYQKYQVEPHLLVEFVSQFFSQGGQGLNVTLPFKNQILSLATHLSIEAKVSGSINTLMLNQEGEICGDTTDGKGLLVDLKRLGVSLKRKSVLIIGAGGASQSVIYSLLSAGAKITLYNRSQSKAEAVIKQFSNYGNIELFDPSKVASVEKQYSLMINCVSRIEAEFFQPILPSLSHIKLFYDLNYGERAEQLKQLVESQGVKHFADGFGMLVAQAAESHKLWHQENVSIDHIQLADFK
jgi:shikimate dehydrogenase